MIAGLRTAGLVTILDRSTDVAYAMHKECLSALRDYAANVGEERSRFVEMGPSAMTACEFTNCTH